MKKKVLAVILAVTLAFGSMFAVSAADGKSGFAPFLEKTLNKVIDGALTLVAPLLPDTAAVKKMSTYVENTEFKGDDEFIDNAKQGAKWSLGYANDSILPDDFYDGGYYKGGYALDQKMTDCIDDLKVRVAVLDDNSGRGKTVFAVVDCIGLANADVKLIREALKPFAKANDIVSINVSATHIHSGIDTQGVYTNIIKSALLNIMRGYSKVNENRLEPAISEKFLNIIIDKTVECTKKATESMTTGTLTYSAFDAEKYVRDRTAPFCLDENLYKLEFTPDDNSNPTILASLGVHPENIGFNNPAASADFVYYTEQVLNDNGYNFMFIQGMVGTFTEDTGAARDGLDLSRTESSIRYGKEIGYILLGMNKSESYCEQVTPDEFYAGLENNDGYSCWYEDWTPIKAETVEPILNIAQKEMLLKIDCKVYEVLAKLSLADNAVYKDGRTYYTPTEVGYMELGKTVKVFLSPGETYGELLKGGEGMEGFPFASIREKLGDNVIVFDLFNDAVGYVMPDNEFMYLHVDNDNGSIDINGAWGLTSAGKTAASQLIGKFYEVADSVR